MIKEGCNRFNLNDEKEVVINPINHFEEERFVNDRTKGMIIS
jgi:hypothetical protein